MTEEEFLEDQKRQEEAALLIKQAVVQELKKEERNEDFVHWEGVTYKVNHGDKTKQILSDVDGWLRGGTLTALMVCIL